MRLMPSHASYAFPCVCRGILGAHSTTLPHDISARYRASRTHGTLPGTTSPLGYCQLRTRCAGFALCRADDRGGTVTVTVTLTLHLLRIVERNDAD